MEQELYEIVFVASDEGVNSFGFRVLTEGVSLDRYNKNPIVLYNHLRSEDNREPIGRFDKVWKEEGVLKVTGLVLDLEDTFAMSIGRKLAKKILNTLSIGFFVTEWSEDASVMVAGQKRATATKTELLEISITDIPSNGNAVRLYAQDGRALLESEVLQLSQIHTMTTEEKPAEKQTQALSLQDIVDAIKGAGKPQQSQAQEAQDYSSLTFEDLQKNPELSAKLLKEDAERYKKLAEAYKRKVFNQ